MASCKVVVTLTVAALVVDVPWDTHVEPTKV
jgi:hypothetical protein